MVNTYLLGLLKSLSAEERRELDLFVASPYFNRNDPAATLQAMLQEVWRTAPDFPADRLTREDLGRRLFPDQPLPEEKWERLLAELNKVVRTFLLTRHYFARSNQFQQALDLAGILRRRNQEARYQQEIARAGKLLDNEPWESVAGLYRRLQLAVEVQERLSFSNHAKGDVNLPAVIHALNHYYLTFRLDLQNRLLAQQSLTRLDLAEDLALELNGALLLSRYIGQSPLLLLTEKTHQVLSDKHPSVVAFQELLDLLKQYESRIYPEELKLLYTSLRNYCSTLINAGDTNLIPALHRIHQDNLSKGYFYYEGKMHHGAYLNVARIALKAGAVEWAKEFIESHRERVLGESEAFYRLNLATYYFAVRQYQQALDIMPLTPAYSDAHLLARRLELKAYYELNSDLLPYRIDAFKMFISRASRKSLSDALREFQSNFINLLHQLTQSIPGDKARAAQLLKRIERKKLVAERDWLLEKARELGEARG